MKIQCNVCAAEAAVLCCADAAALCWACDVKVHAANKLAGRHQRVPLSGSSSKMPKCDICKEMSGYIFCLEDRALLCRKCDVAIHTANTYVSAHQRFLLTGVKVGLEPAEPRGSSSESNSNSHAGQRVLELKSGSGPPRRVSMPSVDEFGHEVPVSSRGVGDYAQTKVTTHNAQFDVGTFSQWQLDELMWITRFKQNYGSSSADNDSSKADIGKCGDSDSSILRPGVIDIDNEECLGQVPDTSWAVPHNPSLPTASGLHWPRNYYNCLDSSVYVPDINNSPEQKPCHYRRNGMESKRVRQF